MMKPKIKKTISPGEFYLALSLAKKIWPDKKLSVSISCSESVGAFTLKSHKKFCVEIKENESVLHQSTSFDQKEAMTEMIRSLVRYHLPK